MNLQQNNLPDFESTLKSTDTEEFIDIHFYRPLGYRWALLFHKWRVTPNQITILSILIGIVSGVCFYFQDLRINLVGIFLLIWANTYDSADGQLARMTNQKTELGRILDGAGGCFWFGSIYLAIVLRSWEQWHFWTLLLAVLAGYCHSKQASMADYYRNLHLFFIKGKNDSELDNSQQLKEKYKYIHWGQKPFVKFFERMYINYTIGQEKCSPNLQKLLEMIYSRYSGTLPEWLPRAFRERSFPLLKYTNMLSFNLRSIVLFLSVLLKIPVFYFLFEITVMNGILIYMVRKYENTCKSLMSRIE